MGLTFGREALGGAVEDGGEHVARVTPAAVPAWEEGEMSALLRAHAYAELTGRLAAHHAGRDTRVVDFAARAGYAHVPCLYFSLRNSRLAMFGGAVLSTADRDAFVHGVVALLLRVRMDVDACSTRLAHAGGAVVFRAIATKANAWAGELSRFAPTAGWPRPAAVAEVLRSATLTDAAMEVAASAAWVTAFRVVRWNTFAWGTPSPALLRALEDTRDAEDEARVVSGDAFLRALAAHATWEPFFEGTCAP